MFIENPWNLEISVVTKLGAFGYDHTKLFEEFIICLTSIKFKQNTNQEDIFKENREANESSEFWKAMHDKKMRMFESVLKCHSQCLHWRILATMNNVRDKSYSKISYLKNVYRNRLTDSYLDDLLKAACSSYKSDKLWKFCDSIKHYFSHLFFK